MTEAETRQPYFVIAVHAGAGRHSKVSEAHVVRAMKAAMRAAGLHATSEGASAVDVISEAVAALEDSEHTNAGIGSALNIDGTAECDASIVDGSRPHAFSLIGAMSGMRNPIRAAHRLLMRKLYEKLPYGLVPASVLVGAGARGFASSQGLEACCLETAVSKFKWQKYKRKLEEPVDIETVGAVCILGHDGHPSAGASSGGSWMKPPGRVGAAGCFGAACFANESVGVAVSGQGESLISTLAAYEIAREQVSLQDDDQMAIARILAESNAGAICLERDPEQSGALLTWAHSAHSMAIGYYSSSMTRPVAFVSRRKCHSAGVKLHF
mmetsp:Transcript_6371/g.19266  ORF Transcript_6371/g.19266 Transcript_6371/m.19266 type:complete len:325 (+) Transcript_6371:194-1168(+)|eukprot:CAMPEP_0198736648 /NCGR_PEP_ID=MMETSP1475-20131203/67257_1 /TAXON_ID= ORGANISM="Unidentified sp., Strain CCMP1999" /NCGR_SAMPLE_ID=MMETSP1475 /ASSEMBLY_ACC=CAM_ASM_001111 /LENGTH=324 /DNA_ID=CAMNT_0044500495 /DNA_START=151 /DNA_END=1125 /DNA_ORIENTATION=-